MKLPSRTLYEGPERAPARAQLKGIGFTDEDLRKPIIGIANTWIGTMPCNWLLRDIAVEVARGIREAGGTPMAVPKGTCRQLKQATITQNVR